MGVKEVGKTVVQICDKDGEFKGTGFFILYDYCVTCHHVIYNLDEIKVKIDDKLYDAKYVKVLSKPELDIAVLKVNHQVQPYKLSYEIYPESEVMIWCYTPEILQNFTSGRYIEAKIGKAAFPINIQSSNSEYNNEWNIKPKGKVEVYELSSSDPFIKKGISGSPVYDPKLDKIVGMVHAIYEDANRVYIIPMYVINSIVTRGLIEHCIDIIKGLSSNDDNALDEYKALLISFGAKPEVESARMALEKPMPQLSLGTPYNIVIETLLEYKPFIEPMKVGRRDPKVLLQEGNMLYASHKYDEAIEAFDKAIAINPNFADAWHNKGNALYNLQKYEEAIKAYDKAIAINPNFADAWHNKGVALAKLQRYEEAIKAYDETIEINPNFAEAWYNKGNALANLQRYEEAIKAYDKAIEINPNYANAWYNKGAALSYLQRYDKAIKAIDKAITINPNDAEAKRVRELIKKLLEN